MLELPNGIPSHDTFNRFFEALETLDFVTRFLQWTRSITEQMDNESVHIDGKTIRGSRKSGNNIVNHLVSAWADRNALIIGQVRVENKSNEITTIPVLLEALLLKGTIVTIDAIGCQ